MSAILENAVAAEARAQTPPNGDHRPYYFCPACGDQRETRGEIRAHLAACPDYRAFIVGSTRRADLLPPGAPVS
jgi:hypothetical protein